MSVSFPSATENPAEPALAVAPMAAKRWIWPVTAMMFVLGMFIAFAVKSGHTWFVGSTGSSSLSSMVQAYQSLRETVDKLQLRIEALQTENTKLSADMAKGRSGDSQTGKALQEAQFLAGLTKVTGPGVVVTLKDSTKQMPTNLPSGFSNDLANNFIIHDVDIQRVLNELRAGGAEALAVNDQRVVASTAVRCVGPAIQVNGVPQTPPFRISAIGDPKSLTTTLEIRNGIMDSFKQFDPAMMSIAATPKLLLPPYAGFQPRFAKPVFEAGTSGS